MALNAFRQKGDFNMLHPSYTDLIVMAASKRARQIIGGEEPLVKNRNGKPLSMAVEELYSSKVRIVGDEEEEEE